VDCANGLTFCAVSVKAHMSGKQLPRVVSHAEWEAAPQMDGSTALRTVVGRVSGSLPTVAALGRTQYKLQVVPEPPVSAREMETSLRWALSASNGAALEDCNLAWLPIPTAEQLPARPRQIYAVLTPTAELTAQMAAWRESGLRPKVVDIRETALRNLAAALERPGEGLALVSADAFGVSMVFTFQGALYLDRFIEQPLAELRAAEGEARTRMHERIAQQLLRSVDVISRNYPFITLLRVLVAPMPEDLGLQDYLADHVPQQAPLQVLPLDLNEIFDLSRVPELADSSAMQARSLVALGAALRSPRAA